MKNKKNKIFFSILLIILLLFNVVFNVIVNAAYTTSGDYTYSDLENGGICIEEYNGTETVVKVPSTIDSKKVIKIGTSAFKAKNDITKVILPDGIESIDAYAFNDCLNLTTVDLPDSLNYISRLFIDNCPKLTNYTIPEGLTKISNNDYQRVVTMNISGSYYYDKAMEMIELTNEEREKEGLTPFEIDASLTHSAMLRAAEISVYFDHIRPDGASCFSANSKIDGENIGAGSLNASMIIEKWMGSWGHRRQIMSEDNVSIGIGCYTSGGYTYWVQLFSHDTADNQSFSLDRINVNNTVQVAVGKGYINPLILGIESENELKVGETLSPTSVRNLNTAPDATGFRTEFALSDLTWESSNEKIFTVDEKGTITAKGVGTATLTASIGEYSEDFTINVLNPIPEGHKLKLNYYEYQLDGLNDTITLKDEYILASDITWTSTNEKVATVENGVVTPKAGGFTYIEASTEGYGNDDCWIYVCALRTMSDGSKAYPGDLDRNGMINANDTALVLDWTKQTGELTEDEIAIADANGDGAINANDAALIADIYGYGMFAPGDYNPITKISLNETSLTLEEGESAKLVATLSPTDTTDSLNITWTSSNPYIATVDENGNVTFVSGGTAIITATSSNGLTANCEVTADGPIKVQNLGDMDKNGKVTPYDALLINVMYEQRKTPTAEELQIGDIDGNGRLTPYDALLINVAYENRTTLEPVQ